MAKERKRGKLEKLKLIVYEDPGFKKKGEEFEVFLNPGSYNQSYKISYTEDQTSGSKGNAFQFTMTPPQDLKLELIFDRTGVLKEYPPQQFGVQPDIDRLKNLVYEYHGKIHRPNYILVSWGTLLFHGCLTNMAVNYTLFDPGGNPIRAKVQVTFREFKDKKLIVKEQDDQSSDITHIRIADQGDTLPLLAYRVYGDPKYYIDVAKANRMTSFQVLQPGQRIVFPPVKAGKKEPA